MRLIRLRDGDAVVWFRPDEDPPWRRPRVDPSPFRDFVHVSLTTDEAAGWPPIEWPEPPGTRR